VTIIQVLFAIKEGKKSREVEVISATKIPSSSLHNFQVKREKQK